MSEKWRENGAKREQANAEFPQNFNSGTAAKSIDGLAINHQFGSKRKNIENTTFKAPTLKNNLGVSSFLSTFSLAQLDLARPNGLRYLITSACFFALVELAKEQQKKKKKKTLNQHNINHKQN